MELCECGCGMFRCWDCTHQDESPIGRKEQNLKKMRRVDMQVNDKVILMANKEEGWEQEIGIITTIQDQEKYPGMYIVQIIETPTKMDDSDDDDGIREVHEDFIIPYPTGRKERNIRKMWDFGRNYGSRHGRMTSHRNYLVQEQNARNLMMQMNFAEIEMLVMASYLKCKGDCPLLKLLFPPKSDSQLKE